MSKPSSRTSFIIMSMLVLALFAALCWLGNWQMVRLAWKENLITTIESRIHKPPHDLEAYIKTEPGTDYWPVRVTGTFRHQSERHFFATNDGQSGFFVYTPLETAPNNFVFINRGFVPYDNKDAATRPAGQIPEPVTITGLARSTLPEKPSSSVPDNDPIKNIFYWKDIVAMTASADLPAGATVQQVFVDADKTPNPGGLPVGGVTIVVLPNNHLQYAVTWYGCAGALLVIWSILAWRQRNSRSAR